MRAVVLLRILKHHLERFEVGVDVSYQSVLHSVQRKSPCDFKPSKIILTLTKYDFLVPDVTAQARIPNRLQERLQFGPLALGDQFHTAIRQIPDDAENIVPGNQGLHCVSETHSLHPPRVVYMDSNQTHIRRSRTDMGPAGTAVCCCRGASPARQGGR